MKNGSWDGTIYQKSNNFHSGKLKPLLLRILLKISQIKAVIKARGWLVILIFLLKTV